MFYLWKCWDLRGWISADMIGMWFELLGNIGALTWGNGSVAISDPSQNIWMEEDCSIADQVKLIKSLLKYGNYQDLRYILCPC